MRIFGLQVGKPRPTDEEYVEEIRKRLRVNRWRLRFHAILSLTTFVVGLWAIEVFRKFLSAPDLSFAQQNTIYILYVSALGFGWIVGSWMAVSMWNFGWSLRDRRTDQLLLETWDKMQALRTGSISTPNCKGE
jgi:hypothetical protein